MDKDEKDKKPDGNSFPWGIFLGFLGTVLVAYLGYLGTLSQIVIPIQATQTAEAKLPQSANINTSQLPLTNMETPAIVTNDLWVGDLIARLPTSEEVRVGVHTNIWLENSIRVSDLHNPDVITYYGYVQKNKEYVLPIYWCAKSSNLLTENLASISTQFSVNGEYIPEKYIRSYNFEPDNNWKCNSYAVIFGGWNESTQYKFEVKRTLNQNLNDGISDYLAGDYVYKLVIDVQ